MGFQKGQPRPPGAGRRKGSKNIKKVARVADYLAERDINPAEKILDLIANGGLEARDKVNAWLDLLSYCQAKPKAVDEDGDDQDDEDFEGVATEDLLKLVRPPTGNV